MQLISKEGVKLPKSEALHYEIEVKQLREGLYKLTSGKFVINVSQKRLDEIIKAINPEESVVDLDSDSDDDLNELGLEAINPEKILEERIALELQAKEAGVKGNISNMKDATLVKKIKEAEGNA